LKDIRIGESLWDEWCGNGYEVFPPHMLVFYTIDHVDTNNELVRRALASCLQRDGVSDSLADAFRCLESSDTEYLWAGYVDNNNELEVCDEYGLTEYGELVDEIFPITLVEF
jgi:hypothetical protein